MKAVIEGQRDARVVVRGICHIDGLVFSSVEKRVQAETFVAPVSVRLTPSRDAKVSPVKAIAGRARLFACQLVAADLLVEACTKPLASIGVKLDDFEVILR